MRANLIMDNLFASGKAKKMIVVMPDGNVTPSFSTNYTIFQDRFPEELVNSVVP